MTGLRAPGSLPGRSGPAAVLSGRAATPKSQSPEARTRPQSQRTKPNNPSSDNRVMPGISGLDNQGGTA